MPKTVEENQLKTECAFHFHGFRGKISQSIAAAIVKVVYTPFFCKNMFIRTLGSDSRKIKNIVRTFWGWDLAKMKNARLKF